MTRDGQTQQLSRQQVIHQYQRPVALQLTWRYRRNVCDLHDSCNTQLLNTWVHRTPRSVNKPITVQQENGYVEFFGCPTICGLLKSAFHHSPYPAVAVTPCAAEEWWCLAGWQDPTSAAMWTSVALILGESCLMGIVKSMSDLSKQIQSAHPGHLGEGIILSVLLKKIYHSRLITDLSYAKSELCNMWHWTTSGTQTQEPLVRIYISANSFSPRLSASR